jgi:hypothetical protein
MVQKKVIRSTGWEFVQSPNTMETCQCQDTLKGTVG